MEQTALDRPSQSSDLTPCNCHSFDSLKEALGGKRFDNKREWDDFLRKWWVAQSHALCNTEIETPSID